MSISVPSRFACLNVEDDDFDQPTKQDKKKAEKPIVKRQERPNGNGKKVAGKCPNKKDKKAKVVSDKQWQEWKDKDDGFVSVRYEQDLEYAILLSTLDFEEKKDVYHKTPKDAENGKKTDKKKKNKPMSLEQFLGSNENELNGKADSEISKLEKVEKDDKFFKKIELETQGVITKEKNTENRKVREANIEEVITIAHCQEKLEREREKNAELRRQLEQMKGEISAVKARNKTLCGILGHGEMKEKADVLVELERLSAVKNELTDEVARLHVLLEQERSKVAALTSESQKHKDKSKNK